MVNKKGKKSTKFQKLDSAKKSNEGSVWSDSSIAIPGSINPAGSSIQTEESEAPLHNRYLMLSLRPGDTGKQQG